jgi:phage gp29-like protein
MRVGRYGPEASDEEKTVLWRAVANIAGDCAAIIPKGMEIEFIEAADKKDGSDLYERRADWFDRQVSKAVLGQTTTTDAVSGGHAVSREHRLVQEDIERADARMLTVTLTRQLAQQIIAFNFGPQPRYPTLRIGRPDEVPLKDLVDAIQKLGPLGLEVEAGQVRDRLGLAEPAQDAPRIGGRQPAPPVTDPASAGAPSLNSMRRLLVSRHVTAPEPEVMAALTDSLARDAEGALAGLVDEVRAVFEGTDDWAEIGRRLAALQLSPDQLARVLGQGMALAHLAGEAAALDELQRGQG